MRGAGNRWTAMPLIFVECLQFPLAKYASKPLRTLAFLFHSELF